MNLNVHGNNHGKDSSGQPTHESNQGLGRNEVNLNRVLTAAPNEVKFIFGDPASGTIGRYGPNYQPSAVVSGPLMYPDLPVGELRPYMTPLDYDGIDENGNPHAALCPGVQRATARCRITPESRVTTA